MSLSTGLLLSFMDVYENKVKISKAVSVLITVLSINLTSKNLF